MSDRDPELGGITDDADTPPPTPLTEGLIKNYQKATSDNPRGDSNASDESVTDSDFRQTCIDIITPALETDVRDMVRGRVMWRRTATMFEVLGRITGALGTIVAFAGSSDITGATVSRALSFSAGCLGTTSIVSTLFATFSRQQSIERSSAVNNILQTVHLKAIPDVAKALDIQGSSSD
jgi:hypothetical protein